MVERARSYRFCAAIALAVCAAAPAAASPWSRNAGSIFVSSRADYFRASGNFLNSDDGAIDDRFKRLESNTYAEFGATSAITIGAKLVYGSSWITNGIETQSGSGFSEIEGFAQHALWRNDRDAAAVKISGAAPSRFNTGQRPDLVNDGADIEARFLYGRNLTTRPFKVFSSIEAGYRRRFGDASDQLRADALIGVEPHKRVLVLFEGFSTVSIRNETPGGADFDVYKFQPSVVWRAGSQWSIQVGLTQEVGGRNIVLGRTIFAGLWTHF